MTPGKIKICFVLSHLPQGGAERQTINLIRLLDPVRFDITLLLYANREIFYREIYELPVRVISKPANRKGKILKNLSGALFLRKELSKNHYDILHTMLFHNGFWVRLLAPARYHNHIVYSIRNSIEGSSLFESMVEKYFSRNCFIVTNSKSVMEQYMTMMEGRFSNKIRTVYNGIEIDRFYSDRAPSLNDTIIIGTVGRQTTLKNHIQILRVANEIWKDLSVHFYIIGDSDQDSYTTNCNYVIDYGLSDHVTIIDSQKDIEKYYKMFNIFILSSTSESCPNVLFEAMLSRCICIVSEGANMDKFITDGHNGFVYNGSDEMLSEKVRYAISILHAPEARSIQDRGQQYVEDNFSMNSMVRNYLEIYDSILVSKH